MTITREINGQVHEIELSSNELCDAYYKKQYDFDQQDIEDVFDGRDDDDLIECYGLGRDVLDTLIEDMAESKRQNIDKYDMDWVAARDCAINDNIKSYKARLSTAM